MDLNTPALSPAAGASLAAAPARANSTTANEAAKNFESFFLSQSFETMFEGTGTDNLFGGGEGENMFRSVLIQQYAKVAASNGGIGIADAVQREILRTQEVK
jgi:Rod binding domain-containing protein